MELHALREVLMNDNHHISNANLENRNHGMDSLMLFVGVSFLR